MPCGTICRHRQSCSNFRVKKERLQTAFLLARKPRLSATNSSSSIHTFWRTSCSSHQVKAILNSANSSLSSCAARMALRCLAESKYDSLVRQFAETGYQTVQTGEATWRRYPYVLDHIFYNRHLHPVRYAVKHTNASDHHMLVAEFEFLDQIIIQGCRKTAALRLARQPGLAHRRNWKNNGGRHEATKK